MLRLLSAEDGQDVVEYALVTATIGIAGIATWPLIQTSIGVAYGNYDANTQNLWVPPDPGAGS
jgi:Flp pilus assembly pilin Flp